MKLMLALGLCVETDNKQRRKFVYVRVFNTSDDVKFELHPLLLPLKKKGSRVWGLRMSVMTEICYFV